MNKKEKGIFISSIIIAILFNELFIFGGIGITVPIYLTVYYSMIFIYCKKSEIKISLKDNMLFIPIILCALCFVLYDNSLLKILNVFFLWFLTLMNTGDILQINKEKKHSFKTLINIFEMTVVYPLDNLSKCSEIINSEFKGKWKGKLVVLRKVVIGLALGAVLLAIVIPLLIHSDAAFSGMIELIADKLNFKFTLTIAQKLAVLFVIFLPIYSFAYGITHEKDDNKNSEQTIKVQIKFDFTIVITLMSVVVAIYLLFCISQFSYFISAFQGILPKDFSYSQYARKGFFESIPLSLINFILIILLNNLLRQNKSTGKRVVMRIYSFFICGISLFIVITAISKLVLYMKAYGLTILRIYSAWFLIVLSLILIAVYIYSFYNKMNLFNSILVIFTTMFLILNYMNIDYAIAKYNTSLDRKDKLDIIMTFKDLSLSAAEPLCGLDISSDNSTNVESYTYIKNKYKNKIENKNEWYYWNYAKYKAKKIFN